MRVRTFTSADAEACRVIFWSNVPKYFLPKEEEDFLSFLAKLPGPYFVLEQASQVVACGGWAAEDDVAVLCWGMVRADDHRSGVGTALLNARVSDARANGFHKFRIRTSQLTEAFYLKFGFKTIARSADGIGLGIDLVEMTRTD